ncbi:MAG TPA: hypothetical protein VJS92_08395 [Candidatus Polarisedimenticolaceae bacterium]|nr:hypothetical protein [Candidatus Polarisedimenticolaceae bacterium]
MAEPRHLHLVPDPEPQELSETSAVVREVPGSLRERLLIAGALVGLGLAIGLRFASRHVTPATIAAPDPPAPPSRPALHRTVEPEGPKASLQVHGLSQRDLPSYLEETLTAAVAAAENGNPEQAELAYRDALVLARHDPQVFRRVRPLCARFEELMSFERRLAPARAAAAQGAYRISLGMLYRLPAEGQESRIRHAQANDWYNLAIVELRAGRCEDARIDLREAEELSPGLGTVGEAQRLAQACGTAGAGRDYFSSAEELRFRGFEE